MPSNGRISAAKVLGLLGKDIDQLVKEIEVNRQLPPTYLVVGDRVSIGAWMPEKNIWEIVAIDHMGNVRMRTLTRPRPAPVCMSLARWPSECRWQ